MGKSTIKSAHWSVLLLTTLLPLMTVVISMAILSGSPEPAQNNQGAAASGGGPGFFGGLFFAIVLTLVLSKVAAIIGIWRRWYFSWVFHAIELQLTTFIMGLVVVVSAFTLGFSIADLIKLLVIFLLLSLNLFLRRLWNEKPTREVFHVGYFSHADL